MIVICLRLKQLNLAESLFHSFSVLVIYYTCPCPCPVCNDFQFLLAWIPCLYIGKLPCLTLFFFSLLSGPLFFPDLLHPLLPLLLRDDRRAVVSLGLGKGSGHNRRAFGADGCADGHEEAVENVSACDYRQAFHTAYPKVAAEPSMYWPSVLIMPLGPGPKRMMLVAPKMKPMIRPTAMESQYRAILYAHMPVLTAAHHTTHLHYEGISF